MWPFSQDEASEEFIGEWMQVRGIRDQIVIATKVRLILTIMRVTYYLNPHLVYF